MNAFFEFIQISLGTREKFSCTPSNDEWIGLFASAKKQSISGVLFTALAKLASYGQKPPVEVLYEWIGVSELIIERNRLLNKACCDLLGIFRDAGFDACILKGQGNALMYQDPLSRTPGDIDIWVKGDKEDTIEFCRSKSTDCKLTVHHISLPIWSGIDVEVHFYPSFTRIPRFEKRAIDFYRIFEKEEIDGKGLIPVGTRMYVPSMVTNLVFQMSHIMRHFFLGGIGLRQIMDYYYLLMFDRGKHKSIVKDILSDLGLEKFAGGVMWILKEEFGMDEEHLLVQVDEKRGKLILDEIMKGGNFGHYDQRFSGWVRRNVPILSVLPRSTRMACLFPEETLWSPIVNATRRIFKVG